MKKYGYWVALLALIVFNLYVFYPTSPETVVERNIRWAEGNGKQLEQVLGHYRSTGEEQKERCARYLIAHMDRRATFTYEGAAQQNEVITPDLLAIRADFLIENIDLAFEVEEISLVQPPDGAGVLSADSALPHQERAIGRLADVLL